MMKNNKKMVSMRLDKITLRLINEMVSLRAEKYNKTEIVEMAISHLADQIIDAEKLKDIYAEEYKGPYIF